jgi:uncharacterized membrane protein (DUF2068 family)
VLILRFFAVERMIRAVIVAAAAYAVWQFGNSRASIEQAFDRELPRLRPFFNQLGYDLDNSKLVELIKHAFTLNPNTLKWIAVLLAAYAVVEIVEAVGLWLARRWGEYFAMVATSAGLPFEVYELVHKITWLRAGALLVNVALVVYLVYAKRLFGARGGGKAYEARLRSESIIEMELRALASGESQAQLVRAAQQPVRAAQQPVRAAQQPVRAAQQPVRAAQPAGPDGPDGSASPSPSAGPDGSVAAPGLTEATNSSAAE